MWFFARSTLIINLPIYFIAIILQQYVLHPAGVLSTAICPKLPPITLFSTPANIQECYGGMDIASYVRGAYALQQYGLEAFGSMGFATWPPGFSFIELMIIKIAVIPLPLALFVLSALLWSGVLFQFYKLLLQVSKIPQPMASVMPLLLLIIPFVQEFYLWDGILMSEPLSTALFAIAVLDIWHHVAARSQITILRAGLLGILFALAVYIRAQFDLIFHAIVFLSFLLIIAYVIFYLVGKTPEKKYTLKNLACGFIVTFLVFQALVLPYKAYLAYKGHGAAMANVTYIFESVWRADSWHIEHGAGFFVAGGGNSMCVVDAAKCEEFELRRSRGENISIEEYKNAAFQVVFSQPFTLLSYKWPYFWRTWINEASGKDQLISFNICLFIALLITAIGRLIQNRKQGLLELLYYLAIIVGSTVFCFIVHFDHRYLLPVKLFGTLWVIVYVTSFFCKTQHIDR